MSGIKLTKKEKAAGLKEIEGPSQPFMPWYNPETGQEFSSLPSDAPNAANYMIRGFRMGPAPQELKDKWEAGEASRIAEHDKRLKKIKDTAEYRKMERDLGKASENQASTEEVASAVIKQLQDLGGIKVPQIEEVKQDEETKAVQPRLL